MNGLKILEGHTIDSLVDPKALIDNIREALLGGRAVERVSMEESGSWLGLMGASSPGFFAVKIVGVYPENPARGLPLVRGLLLLLSASSGEVLLAADAGPATGWRTAAATALALSLMGYSGGGVLGVIGAGVQARYHLEVLSRIYRPSRIIITSRTRARAEALASAYGAELASLEDLLSASQVVVAATNSREPVVRGSLLRSGAFVASVGAPKPVRELDGTVIERSRCVLVDTRSGAERETDDVKGAREVVELREMLEGRKCEWGDIRVYKSVGYSLFDLAIALHLYSGVAKKTPR